MNTRKTNDKRDVAAPIGPGEFVPAHYLPGDLPWKRVLEIAAAEMPDFLPSLLHVPDGEPRGAHLARWLARWHLPGPGSIPAHITGATLQYHAVCAKEGIDPEPGPCPHLVYRDRWDRRKRRETPWTVAGETRTVFWNLFGADLSKVLRADDGHSVLTWNPYYETRADAAARLHHYVDLALAEIAHQFNHSVGSDGAVYCHQRTPELPQRHIVWFVRWKFKGESLYGLAQRAHVTEQAVRKAVDSVAAVLDWGHRNGEHP